MVLQGKVDGKQKQGKPKATWIRSDRALCSLCLEN